MGRTRAKKQGPSGSARKLKVMTVLGTRPEIIRLSRVIAMLDEHMEHVLVHTGQNYDHELNQIFFDDLGIRPPDHFLDAHGDNPAETVSRVISAADKVMAHVSPDAVLILGDTNSCLAVYPAKRRKIPVFHMEAGNRCFDERVPEEINRRIVDHISDINMPYSDISREYLLREGLQPDRVIKTGSPMMEVIQHNLARIEHSRVLVDLGLEEMGYFLLSFHREENVDSEHLDHFVTLLGEMVKIHMLPVVVSTHPRTRKRLDAKKGLSFGKQVRLLKPFCFTDYLKLQLNARAVLSDSGTISEEASILNIPALNLREAHERPEAMEETAAIMVGMNPDRVMQALEVLARAPRGNRRLFPVVRDYDVPNVSDKVVRIILSHVDVVNRVVWRKGV